MPYRSATENIRPTLKTRAAENKISAPPAPAPTTPPPPQQRGVPGIHHPAAQPYTRSRGAGRRDFPGSSMTVGVLALQGSYNEHIAALRRVGAKGVEIRKPEQLEAVDALIIPGGESTTMAKLANYHNLFPALREFVSAGNPVWGTCAGLIFLANQAVGQKSGGQELVGGLDCTVHRNFFGSQLQSFETELSVPKLAEEEGGPNSCRGVFIRAPAILKAGSSVEVLADYPVPLDKLASAALTITEQEEYVVSPVRVIVAVRQGNILGTAFHPELTADTRWHTLFLKMRKTISDGSLQCVSTSQELEGKKLYDLPIFE